MKFVVDAHLPPSLCKLLQSAGHDAIHTTDLVAQNRTADKVLSEISLNERRVVVTKDADFYHSHLLHGIPWKLLIIRTGNIRTRDLKILVERHLAEIVSALETNSLVELDWHAIRIIA